MIKVDGFVKILLTIIGFSLLSFSCKQNEEFNPYFPEGIEIYQKSEGDTTKGSPIIPSELNPLIKIELSKEIELDSILKKMDHLISNQTETDSTKGSCICKQ